MIPSDLGVGRWALGVDADGQQGGALLPVLLIMLLFSAIAVGASIVVRTEVSVSARYRRASEALYAADAGLSVALSNLRDLPSWTPALDGTASSPLSQGLFQGSRAVPGGGAVLLCCGPGSVSDRIASDSRLSPVPARRALVWQPYLWSSLDAITGGAQPSGLFVAVFVADDEQDDGDGDPRRDVNGVVTVRAEAVEPNGVHRTVEALIRRRDPGPAAGPRPAIGMLRWREIR